MGMYLSLPGSVRSLSGRRQLEKAVSCLKNLSQYLQKQPPTALKLQEPSVYQLCLLKAHLTYGCIPFTSVTSSLVLLIVFSPPDDISCPQCLQKLLLTKLSTFLTKPHPL